MSEMEKNIIHEAGSHDNQGHEDEHESIKREINGKKTYKTKDVALMLDESPAMIGYYCREFAEHLPGLQREANKHRVFTEEHIEVLRAIIGLIKNEHYTVDQAKYFYKTKEGKNFLRIDNGDAQFKAMVDIIVNRLESSIENIVDKKMEQSLKNIMPNMLESSIDKINDSITGQEELVKQTIKEAVKEEISSLGDISELLNSTNEGINKVVEEVTHMDEMVVTLREKLNEKHEEKKGFWNRIFKSN